MIVQTNPTTRDFVIIRAFADEPVRLLAVGVRGKAVEAVGADERDPMPYHLDRAYCFDPDLFRKMRRAFERGQADALEKLWETAAPFEGRARTA